MEKEMIDWSGHHRQAIIKEVQYKRIKKYEVYTTITIICAIIIVFAVWSIISSSLYR